MDAEPEKLERGMFSDASRMTSGPVVERPPIEQDNDIDTPFATEGGGPIPQHLQELIQYASVDAEEKVPEVVDVVAEENPQSRFRVLNVAALSPGVCALCGSSGGDGRQFVDFGKTMDWYGVVYFCTFCVTEAAKLIGLEEADDKEIVQLRGRIARTDETVQYLEERLSAANLLLRDHLNGDCNPVVPVVEIPEADVIESESSVEGKSNPDESVVVEGSDDVSGPSGDDEPVEPVKPVRRVRKSS